MERAINDATLSKMGDIYQYYIALLDCFNMKQGDILQIEINGDVSMISKKNDTSYQKEIKHHVGNDKLSDRDVDLWNTLKNWLCDYSRTSGFSKLILFTTSDIPTDCIFHDWNSKTPAEKQKIIRDAGKEVREREEGFRLNFTKVIEHAGENDVNLNSVLSRFSIEFLQPQISNLSSAFNAVAGYIPINNRNNYIASLLGIVLSKVKDPPHKWELSKEDFDLITQEQAATYARAASTPLPNEFSDISPTLSEQDKLKDKLFVREIQNIEYDVMIPSAIVDYWRMDMTVLRYFSDNLVYNKSLPDYKEDLKTRLFHTKEEKQVDYYEVERPQQIKESKKMYNAVMAWKAEDFGSITHNRAYFQNGIVHDIVNDGHFTWDVGEKNER